MKRIFLPHDAGFNLWRDKARAALQLRLPPDKLDWVDPSADQNELLLEGDAAFEGVSRSVGHISPKCLKLLESILRHRDFHRFALAYRILWRSQSEPYLPSIATDPDIRQAARMESQLRRDAHKMKAFVRFREAQTQQGKRRHFLSWFEPEHFILETVAPFFAERFSDMNWMILTPIGSIVLEIGKLTIDRSSCQPPKLEDDVEALWHRYYQSIFNPARIKTKTMRSEMPVRYWKNLPETQLIPSMLAGAEQRVAAMVAQQPNRVSSAFHDRNQAGWAKHSESERLRQEALVGLPALNEELRICTRCDLCRYATQAVPGAGREGAALMLIGEQPGDQEDLHGTPFVGPAGQVLDRALSNVGITREEIFLTNAVKHFKFVSKGRRRIHQSPGRTEIAACASWLQKEIALVRPRLIVSLGATALQALEGPSARLATTRGHVREASSDRPASLATIHPSYLLRLPDTQRAGEEERRFTRELATARDWLKARIL